MYKSAIVFQYVDQYEIFWCDLTFKKNIAGTVRIGRVLKQFAVDFSLSCPLLSLLKIIGQGENYCDSYLQI